MHSSENLIDVPVTWDTREYGRMFCPLYVHEVRQACPCDQIDIKRCRTLSVLSDDI
jgi:hypothetical protein